ncbi:hypothetical protein D3C86_1940340 [compost metagenome]
MVHLLPDFGVISIEDVGQELVAEEVSHIQVVAGGLRIDTLRKVDDVVRLDHIVFPFHTPIKQVDNLLICVH